MKTRKILALVLSLVMVFSLCSTALAAAHLTDDVTELEQTNSDLSMALAMEAYVLFENNGVLPLKGEKAVALFGNATETTVKGGTGSGDVNQRSRDHIDEAFAAAGWTITNPTWIAKIEATKTQGGGCGGGGVKADQEITAEELAEAKTGTDLAVYSICRNAGEGADRKAEKGDYFLTDVERANLELLAVEFDRLVVVLNTCVIDTAWAHEIEGIDAVLYMSNGGQRGGEALVNVLEGEVSPSGKLTDTWPLSYADYPSNETFGSNDGNTATEWYNDGIYVGYRYFDTFGLDVSYEFGYGLSYTEFDIDVVSANVNADEVEVVVDVTNVGNTYSGKEVVQVYFSAPDGRLEKPYQELAAYGKTAELAPGEKQTLTLTYATEDMSSYDEELAAYIMEDGEYIIRVGNSSRNTQVAAVATLDTELGYVITEQLSNQVTPEDGAVLEEISKEGATPITYEGEAAEIAAAPAFEIVAEDLPYANNASTIDDETVTTYLFEEDAANYEARKGIILRTKNVAGIIANNNGKNGYEETIYDEVVEIVPALPEGITKETAKLTDVYTGKITMEQFVACLSEYEVSRICVGGAGSATVAPDGTQLGTSADSVPGGAGQTTLALLNTRHVPSMPNADGPAGIRISQSFQKDTDGDGKNDTTYYQFCTAFPAGTCMAGAWDVDLNYLMGEAIGKEMQEYGVTHWLAPALNIHRNALCGRNFEYFSEDPLVSGMVAAYLTAGVQATPGIGVTLKHFWGNSQENNRNAENNVISERTAREIYLKGFEIAVKLAQPMCMMNCYNENNGWPGSDDYDTNYDILREEWGFKGFVMTDWGGGQSSAYIAKHGGCDMVMPGSASNPNVVLSYIGTTDPQFGEDGDVFVTVVEGTDRYGRPTITRTEEWGSFVASAGGSVEYRAYVDGYEALSENVLAAIAEGKAKFCDTADADFVTWYGEHINRIALGDVQKSAINILNVAMQSKDMVNLGEAVGVDVKITPWSALNNAPLAADWTMAEKSEIAKVGLEIGKVVADAAAGTTVEVPVTYTGDEAITSVRFTLDSELPMISIESDYALEQKSEEFVEDGKTYTEDIIIVYNAEAAAMGENIATITVSLTNEKGWVANGEYAITAEVVDATSAATDEEIVVKAIDGVVIVDNTYAAGDANLNGEVTNADLVAIARYLVELVEFNAEQFAAADIDNDGEVDNSDLIKLAREIVGA